MNTKCCNKNDKVRDRDQVFFNTQTRDFVMAKRYRNATQRITAYNFMYLEHNVIILNLKLGRFTRLIKPVSKIINSLFFPE